jgi:formate hydrogenlyase subunit 3/multisubunit Na+/H+ antiporter MnhD subunit
MALAVVLPAAGAVLALAFPRHNRLVALASGVGTVAAVGEIVVALLRVGAPLRHAVGGWGAPLGIELAVDGLSAVMLTLCAIVSLCVGLYASAYFATKHAPNGGSATEHRAMQNFWPLALLLWASLNALFLSADAFNLYVTLEAVSLAGVALTALGGEREAVAAAFRYLLAGMLASLTYLLGVGLLYAEHATLDLVSLGELVFRDTISFIALPLVLAGLTLKCALFPLHFWLPSAHANAPAPVSALLSALVVKAALYLLLRWWLDVLNPGLNTGAAQFIGALGAAAVLWGSTQALLASRLKIAVAYSTVAQLGYPLLLFPLALEPGLAPAAWYGAIYLALAHGFAKSAMFLAAGNVVRMLGHDHLDALVGVGARVPVSAFAMGLAGVSLIGLPPSGGFVGKWMLLEVAIRNGQWWWVAVIVVGSLLTAAYVLRILRTLFAEAPVLSAVRPPATMEWPAFVLALGAIALGFLFNAIDPVLEVGAPGAIRAVGVTP